MWFQIGSKNSIAKPLKIQSQIFQNSITKPLKSVPKFQSHPCSWNQSFLLNFSLKIKFQSQIEIAKISIVRLKFFNLGAFGSATTATAAAAAAAAAAVAFLLGCCWSAVGGAAGLLVCCLLAIVPECCLSAGSIAGHFGQCLC